jgi:hypothetical protein
MQQESMLEQGYIGRLIHLRAHRSTSLCSSPTNTSFARKTEENKNKTEAEGLVRDVG